ncbi:MAG: glycosyltransferase [Alphaproteobacteria bacterium]|nr:glycosyltransferase [Alphaproteobacteria bacterium]
MAVKSDFSVVVPVHMRAFSTLNDQAEEARCLRQAILSLVHQTEPPAEVVIAVDGPITPQQRDELAHFARQNLPFKLKIVDPKWPASKGADVARDMGARHASRKWIAFLDSDDIAAAERLETERKAIQGAWFKPDIIRGRVHFFSNDPQHSTPAPSACSHHSAFTVRRASLRGRKVEHLAADPGARAHVIDAPLAWVRRTADWIKLHLPNVTLLREHAGIAPAVLANERTLLGANAGSPPEQVPMSVLMCTYNGGSPDELNQSLLSILHQDVPPKEVVLVLDGPVVNGQREVIRRFEEAQRLGMLPFTFKVVETGWDTNRGIPAALNEGLKHCTQPWVARMDADDICLPNRFIAQWDAIRRAEARGERLDLVTSSIQYFDKDPSHTHGNAILPEYHEGVFERFRFLHSIYHPATAFRRDVVQKLGGYDTSFDQCEDFDLWQRMLENGSRFGAVQDPLVLVRANAAQTARRREAFPFIMRCFDRALKNGWLTQEEYDGAVAEHKKRVNNTDFGSRVEARGGKLQIDWPSERIRAVHPAVLENAPIDPENPFGVHRAMPLPRIVQDNRSYLVRRRRNRHLRLT